MSHLYFNPPTGLKAPDTENIRERVIKDWQKAFFKDGLPPLDTSPSTPAGQLIDAFVAEIEAKNAEFLYLSNMFNPQVSCGRWQDALAHIYFLKRKVDEPTIATCQLTGLYKTTIPYGALVSSDDGHTLICNKSVNIDKSGQAETTFRCSETGPIEISANSITQIITTIAGWDTVNNIAAGATGRNLETRAEFEARRRDSVAKNAHGSVGALYGTIANLNDVIDCQILENIGPYPVIKFGVEVPGHGIVVCIYGGHDDEIAEAIYRKKDAGCDTGGNTKIMYKAPDYSGAVYEYKILRPATINFFIKVTLGGKNHITPSMLANLKYTLYQDFLGANLVSGNDRVSLASHVYASRFYTAVMSIEGIKSLRNIEIALAKDLASAKFSDRITINGDQEPVMTKDNIKIVLED